ncbi:MAG: DsbC family protein [Burkholderiales bacterium]|nr:DsbC family protein [Burkholderiales bacterium]
MKRLKWLRTTAGTMLALLAVTGHADEQAIRKMFQAKLPDAKVLSIQKLPYAGLYEIAVQRTNGPAVYYSDASAQALIVGALTETWTDRNLTDEQLSKLSAIDWNGLPFRWAVTTKRGNGRRQIAIFSDPNCPFCRKFEQDLAAIDDITVHIFLYPVIKPESVRQTKSVWCSKDRAKAWNDLMLKGIEPTAPIDCDNPIEELVALGQRLGATSTPTWFLPNGEKYFGALPMSKVVPLLDATARRR